jgi:hypothetical protein
MSAKVTEINDRDRAVHIDTGSVYTYSTAQEASWENETGSKGRISWEKQPQNVMGRKIVPYGENNDLPVLIRRVMDNNHLAPGILERKLGLLYGEGPQLYEVVYEAGEITRHYKFDQQIWDWLNSFNYSFAIQKAMVEYNHMRAIFVKRHRNVGVRIGNKAFITKIEVVSATDARLGWPENNSRNLEDVTTMLTGDFENNCFQSGIKAFPVYDPKDPFRYPVSMSYHSTYSFARAFYPVPTYFGALKWIERSSDIPDIIRYLSENGITTAFHVHSPAGYWEEKRQKLEEMFPSETDAQIDKRLNTLKDETFANMIKVLSGKKNAGKFIETVDFYDDAGNLCEWKIQPIDQLIKDFIEAQLKISEMAGSATTSGMGLHPSLSNIVVNGQLSSGSQVLYALKNYFSSEVAIPEEVIFEAINQVIKVNFPASKLKLGFYRKIVAKEQDVNPEKRVSATT